MKRALTLGLFFIVGITALKAQTTVSGTVNEANTNDPIIGVNIQVKGTTTGTITDTNGQFTLSVDSSTPFTLVFSSVGFSTVEVEVNGNMNGLSVQLEESVLIGEEIVVSASRKREKIQEAPAAVSILSAKQIEKDAVANPILSIRNLTGVNVAQYGVGSGQINLRGRSAVFQTETFVMADYRNLLLPSLGSIQYEQQPIDALDLERVEVIRGPGSALYGPGVEAGIVHFISKNPFQHPGTSVSISGGNQSLFAASFRHAGYTTNEKLGYKVTGFYRTAEDFQLDPNDPVQAARLASYPTEVVSGVDGSFITSEVPNYTQRSYGVTGTLEYRASEITTITGTGGFSRGEALFRQATGEGFSSAGRPFAQVRVQSGGLFGQAFWSYQDGSDGEQILYSTGQTVINEAHQLEGQLQYNFQAGSSDNVDVTVGADYRLNSINTDRTLHGRFEDNDDYTIFGGYAQVDVEATDKLNVIAAGRVDRFEALDDEAFSPRLGLVYKAAKNHTIRGTWNRAFGAPNSLNLNADVTLGGTATAPQRLLGGAVAHTYDEGVVGEFLTGGTLPSEDLPLQLGYGAATPSVLAALGVDDPAFADLLNSRIAVISGTSDGTVTGAPITRGTLQLSESDVYEIGYKGSLMGKLSLSLDVYYNKRRNNLTAPVLTSPFVVFPTLGPDLGAVVASSFTDEELAPYGLNVAALSATYAGVGNAVALDENGNPNALGALVSDQVFESVNGAAVSLAYLNIAEIDYWGIDFGAEYFYTRDISVFGNVSWLSQNYWDNAPISGSETGVEFSLNVPDTQIKAGLAYQPESGFYGSLTTRYTSAWRSVNSAFTGDVDAFTLIDVGAGYQFDFGMNVGVTVNNIFDVDYKPTFGVPSIGTLAIGKISYEF